MGLSSNSSKREKKKSKKGDKNSDLIGDAEPMQRSATFVVGSNSQSRFND